MYLRYWAMLRHTSQSITNGNRRFIVTITQFKRHGLLCPYCSSKWIKCLSVLISIFALDGAIWSVDTCFRNHNFLNFQKSRWTCFKSPTNTPWRRCCGWTWWAYSLLKNSWITPKWSSCWTPMRSSTWLSWRTSWTKRIKGLLTISTHRWSCSVQLGRVDGRTLR